MDGFYISRIKAQNFKGFDSIDIDLKKFNILTGSDPERSDLLQVFLFLWYIRVLGFEFTMGIHDWRAPALKKDLTLSLECYFKSDSPIRILESGISDNCTMTTDTIVYKLSINFLGNHCSVSDDHVTADVIFTNPDSKKIPSTIVVDMHKITMKPVPHLEFKGMPLVEPEYYPVLGNSVITKLVSPEWNKFLSKMSVYDFVYPEYLKSKSYGTKHILDRPGADLSGVLHYVENNPKMKEILHSRARDLIPAFESVSTRGAPDSIEFCLRTDDSELSADLVSDENARILALLTCMILPREFSAIESPERDISPMTLQKISQMMAEPSRCGQLVVSTGSPEVLKYAKPGNVLVVYRNKDGRLCVSAADHEETKNLQNTLGSGNVKKPVLELPKHPVTDIRVEMDGRPPKKGSSGSIWSGKELPLTMNLRMEIYKKQKESGNILPFEGSVSVILVVAAPLILDVKEYGYVGDLDSFIAGVCDAIQPAPPDIIKSNKEFMGPKEIGLDKPLLIKNDSRVAEIIAKKTESKSHGYTLIVRPYSTSDTISDN